MILNFCVQQKPRARRWRYHVSLPHDLILQLISLPRRRTSRDGENSVAGQELFEQLFALSANNNSSSDDGDNSSLDDFVIS